MRSQAYYNVGGSIMHSGRRFRPALKTISSPYIYHANGSSIFLVIIPNVFYRRVGRRQPSAPPSYIRRPSLSLSMPMRIYTGCLRCARILTTTSAGVAFFPDAAVGTSLYVYTARKYIISRAIV